MAKTIKVEITRTEVYREVIEVKAGSVKEAKAKAMKHYEEGRYDYKFDCPETVSASVKEVK